MINVYTYTKWLCSLYKKELGERSVKIYWTTHKEFAECKKPIKYIGMAHKNNGSQYEEYDRPEKAVQLLRDGNHVISFNKNYKKDINEFIIWHEFGHLICGDDSEFGANKWVINEAKKRGYFKIIRLLKKNNDLHIDCGYNEYDKKYYDDALKIDKLLRRLKLDEV